MVSGPSRRRRPGPRRWAVAAAALLLATAGLTVTAPQPARALDNGVARTPPMGWNNWNSFGCDVSEALIKQMADTIVTNGMAELGYRYVVVDDCWFNPVRDSAGNLQGDRTRFPSNMKALGDYLHARGLKFGIYMAPFETCAQAVGPYPGTTGSSGHELADARQFAAWGVDYLKYDWCSPSGTINDQVATFARMRDALAATGRPIVLSINPNSLHARTGPARNWGDVSNIWRTTEDITNRWDTGNANSYPMGIKNIVAVNAPLSGNSAPGRFNDPDMLVVGNGRMTDTEMRTHFAMWAVMAAPLMAGNDLRNASAATMTILRNKNLIDVNQDPLGRQGVQVSSDGTRRVLAKPLSNGDVAVALYNQGDTATTISTTAAAVGKSGSSFSLRDLWTGTVTSTGGTISASVPAHGTVVYRLTGGAAPTGTSLVSAASGRCLDDPRSATANGTQPVIWDCSGAANQRWTVSGATLQIFGKCLDAPRSAVAGDRVVLWDCNGGNNQQWTFDSDGTVRGVRSGLCLDVVDGLVDTGNGTPVGLWTCTAQANQRWTRR